MTLPDDLLAPAAYPHDVSSVALVETHMSWVFLTGAYAYKVKKPVTFDFVDFSRLSDREHFCRRELKLNRAFAPELYVDVVPLIEAADGRCVVGASGNGSAVDWAVKMRQFPGDRICDVLLDVGKLTAPALRRFGVKLADQHAALPTVTGEPIAVAALDNFATLDHVGLPASFEPALRELRGFTERELTIHGDRLERRAADQKVRHCHGDLHLANLVMLDDGIVAFDCLEFSDALSAIDLWADVAFLYMDLCTRGYSNLAYAFIDGYLDASGDYDGALLLRLFATYRALVRAKVRALRFEQSGDESVVDEIAAYVDWAAAHVRRPAGSIIVTRGLTGSGKSYWSQKLVDALGLVRIRSDVLRKRSAGLASDAQTNSPLGGGLYSGGRSEATYRRMAELAITLANAGENVIVDAACLKRRDREILRGAAAEAGVRSKLLELTAPTGILKERIRSRAKKGGDPSEADEQVLEWQLENAEGVSADEKAVVFDTEGGRLEELIERLR